MRLESRKGVEKPREGITLSLVFGSGQVTGVSGQAPGEEVRSPDITPQGSEGSSHPPWNNGETEA